MSNEDDSLARAIVYGLFRPKRLEYIQFLEERLASDRSLIEMLKEKGAPADLVTSQQQQIEKFERLIQEARADLLKLDDEYGPGSSNA